MQIEVGRISTLWNTFMIVNEHIGVLNESKCSPQWRAADINNTSNMPPASAIQGINPNADRGIVQASGSENRLHSLNIHNTIYALPCIFSDFQGWALVSCWEQTMRGKNWNFSRNFSRTTNTMSPRSDDAFGKMNDFVAFCWLTTLSFVALRFPQKKDMKTNGPHPQPQGLSLPIDEKTSAKVWLYFSVTESLHNIIIFYGGQ